MEGSHDLIFQVGGKKGRMKEGTFADYTTDACNSRIHSNTLNSICLTVIIASMLKASIVRLH